MKVILKLMTFFCTMLLVLEILAMLFFIMVGYQIRAWADDIRGVSSKEVIKELRAETASLKQEIRALKLTTEKKE